MAAFSVFVQVSIPPQLPREQIRLAVAIIISALVHLVFASGMTVRAPGPVTARGPAIISVRLETPVTALAEPQQQDGAKVERETVPGSLRRARPADDGARNTAGAKTTPSSAFLEKQPKARIPASALPPVSDPEYYPAHQLDVYPALVQPVNLEYSRDAANENVDGRGLLMLLIDETGSVRELSIIDAGPARVFENSLRAAFSAARFSPARKDGRAVKSRVLIGVDQRRPVNTTCPGEWGPSPTGCLPRPDRR